MQKFTVTQNLIIDPTLYASHHDSVITPYSSRLDAKTYEHEERACYPDATWGLYKNDMFANAKELAYAKEQQLCWLPNTFIIKEGVGNNQTKTNCESRAWIALEWDTDPMTQWDKCSMLSQFVFLSHTSHSHLLNKAPAGVVERYRIMLPLGGTFPTAADYHNDKIENDIRHRTMQWCRNMGIGYAPGAITKQLDESSIKTVQVQFYPGINPIIGVSEIIINDGHGTRFLTIADLPVDLDDDLKNKNAKVKSFVHSSGVTGTKTIDELTAATSSEIAGNMTAEAELHILNICKTALSLRHIISQPEAGKLSRKSIAAAWSALGMSEKTFTELDTAWMKQPTSSTKPAACWNDGKEYSKKYPGILLSIIGKPTLISLGLLSEEFVLGEFANEILSQDVWKNEIVLSSGNYVTRATYGTAQSTLAKFGMGAGKNHGWSVSPSTVDDRIIVLTSLNAIVKQAKDTRNKYFGDRDELHNYNDMCDPYNVTHVYDRATRLIDAFELFDSASENGEEFDNKTMIDPSAVTLVLDEIHNIELADYRYIAISAVSKLITVYGKRFKKLIGQSASIDNTALCHLIKWDDTIKVTRDDAPELTYKRYNKGDASKLDAAAMMIIAMLITETNDKILVLKDDLVDIQTIQTYCKTHLGTSGANVNASSTRQTYTKAAEMASSADYTMGADRLIVGTTSLVEGISIQDEVDTAHVIIIGQRNHNYILQMCGRMRKAKKIVCHHVCDIAPDTFRDALDTMGKRNYRQQQIQDGIVRSHKAAKLEGKTYVEADYRAYLSGIASENPGIVGIQSGIFFNQKLGTITPCMELANCIANAFYANAATYASADNINTRMQVMGFDVVDATNIDCVAYLGSEEAVSKFVDDFAYSRKLVVAKLKEIKKNIIGELRSLIESGILQTPSHLADANAARNYILDAYFECNGSYNLTNNAYQAAAVLDFANLMLRMYNTNSIETIINAWSIDTTAEEYDREKNIAEAEILLPINVVRAAYPVGSKITQEMYEEVVRTYIDAAVIIEADRLKLTGGKINYKKIWGSVTGLKCFNNAKLKKATMKYTGAIDTCSYVMGSASKTMVNEFLPTIDRKSDDVRYLEVIAPVGA